MEDQDIRSLITSRQRKKVPARNTTLTANKITEHTSENTSENTEFISNTQLESDAVIKPPKMGKRLAITLEEDIRIALVSICDRAEVTPETFIEAAVMLLQKDKDLLQEICQNASKRLSERKRAGVKKRSLTMMQKYGLD